MLNLTYVAKFIKKYKNTDEILNIFENLKISKKNLNQII